MNHQKPKLLIVTDTFYPLQDGVLRLIEEFVKRPSLEFDLSVLVPQLSTKKFKDVKTIFYDISKHLKASLYPIPQLSWKNFRHIKKTIKQNDIIFCHGPALVGFYLGLKYARRYKKKSVLYIHNTAWEFLEKYLSLRKLMSSVLKRYFVRLYNKWDLLMVPYKEVEEELRKAGVHTKIKIARLGVDIHEFAPNHSKEERKRKMHLPNKIIVGYVGRVCKEKNTLVLLEAFKKLDQQKYSLLIVGDGAPDIVKKFKDTKNCKVTGFVSNVADYLKATDIFVMPSLTETTSLATLEAMSAGLPVVATKVGFIKSYLVKDHNGVFFPRNNSTLLALKIDKLGKDKALRDTLGHNARKTVAYSFSWERSINKMKRLLIRNYLE